MKSILTRGALAAAVALSLAACGGGKATFTIGGTVQGLKHGPLVLTTNGQDVTVLPKSTNGEDVSYSFGKQLEYGDEYSVSVKTQPPHQTCTSGNFYDTAGRLTAINIVFSCTTNSYPIGGKITGLTSGNLVLINGSTTGTLTVAATTDGTATYSFPKVNWGDTYGVTVLTQPAGLNCTVANGTGTMGDAAVENINVTCVPKT